MPVLQKKQLKLFRKISETQKRHPKTKFKAEHFTAAGELTKAGKVATTRKKRKRTATGTGFGMNTSFPF